MAKVLVVDDERGIRALLVDILGDAGYEVIEAADGSVAIDKACRERPDIIILDVIMPVMDGLQVLARLRGDPATQAIPVVLLTALPAAKGESAGMKLGVTHYINKPWTSGTIEAVVRVALRETMDAPGEGIDEGASVARQGTASSQKTSHEPQMSIKTGSTVMDQKLRGGIPLGSLTLIEGSPSAGKSVLCQHLAYEAIKGGQGVAYFTSDTTPNNLVAQMGSIGLDVSGYLKEGKFRIYPLEEPAVGGDPERLMALLSLDIERLPRKYKVVFLDAITTLASYSGHRAILGLFSYCKRLCGSGRAIILVAHSYAFDDSMLLRLRAMCDAHLKLGIESLGAKLVKTLEVQKMHGAELNTDNMVSFEIESGVGIRIVPGTKVRV